MTAPLTLQFEQDWLGESWQAPGARGQDILTRRAHGGTLVSIANDHHLTRERVRQLQAKAEKVLITGQQTHSDHLLDQLHALSKTPVWSDALAANLIATNASDAREALLHALGFSRPRSWAGPLDEWWTKDSAHLDLCLRGSSSFSGVGRLLVITPP